MIRYKLFIWDFDGTLFDSYPQISRDMCCALRDFGFDIPLEEVFAQVKRSISGAGRRYASSLEIDFDRLMERYQAYAHAPERPYIAPYPGALDVCRRIAAGGGKNCLCTHRGASADRLLARHGFAPFFVPGVTEEDGFPHKPAPDGVLTLLRRYGAAKGEALMVGDRDIDLLAGENAGITGCLFDPDGYYGSFDAAYRVSDMAEFARLFL